MLNNQWKLSDVHPKKLMLWPCQQIKLSSLPLEPILPFQSIVLAIPSPQVWSDGPMFHPWLWIDAKNRFHYCETSPNTRLTSLPCLLARALLVDGHPIWFWGFSSPFLWWSPHLVYYCNVCLSSSYDLVLTVPPNTLLLLKKEQSPPT